MTEPLQATDSSPVRSIFSLRFVLVGLGLLFIVAITSIALVWLKYEINQFSTKTEWLIHDLKTQVTSLDNQLRAVEQRSFHLDEQQVFLTKRYDSLASQLESALQQGGANNRLHQWVFEIDQMLNYAVLVLQTTGDVQHALSIVQLALNRLNGLPNTTALESLRRALLADYQQLKQQPLFDYASATILLDELSGFIQTIPFAYVAESLPRTEESPKSDRSGLAGFFQRAYQRLMAVIRVEKIGSSSLAILSYQQEEFIRESLRLHLLSARTAMLMRNVPLFSSELKQVDNLIRLHFSSTQALQTLFDRLLAQSAQLSTPDYSQYLQSSLKALAVLKIANG